MKRLLAIIAIITLITLMMVSSVAAQNGRAEATVAASAIDTLGNAYEFSPTMNITVTNVEFAALESGEVSHTCLSTPSPGKYSVWFKTYLTSGQVSLDTTGSDYGSSADTVVSLYRLIDDVSFNNLLPVACNDNGTGAGVIPATSVGSDVYFIQVSASNSVIADSGSQIQLTVSHLPVVTISNDNLAKAKPLTFPNNYVVWGVENATLEMNEVLPTSASDIGSNSVWYKFTIKELMMYSFQSAFSFGNSIYFDLFSVETVNNEVTYTELHRMENTYQQFLSPGKYILRVSSKDKPMGQQFGFYNFLTSAYLMPSNASFTANWEMDDGVLDMTGWVIKNASAGEEGVCQDGKCYFRFGSDGATEATSISRTFTIQPQKFKKGDGLYLTAYLLYYGTGHSNLLMTYVFYDAAGKTMKMSAPLMVGEGTEAAGSVIPVPKPFTAVRAKVIIKNRDKSGVGLTLLDGIFAYSLRLGTSSREMPIFGANEALPFPLQ